MRKRILILGGSRFQVPLIRRAKERGLCVITCDYLPENPGHELAGEYHNVSTTDRDGVLALARRIGIDAVASLSSDPAMPTVAHVANVLGLPGPSLDAVVQLTEKDAFRRLMSGLGLPTPASYVVAGEGLAGVSDVAATLGASASRHLVKPVDSCGSKGITVLEAGGGGLSAALQRALEQSRARRCIVEQYIDGAHLHGDGFLQDGRLIHHYLGDQGFVANTHDTVPISTFWPSRHQHAVLGDVARQVEAIARASGYVDGPVNIEARVSPAGEVYIIEIGPRNGGDFIPIIQQRLTGFDFVGRVLDGALGSRSAAGPAPALEGVGACYTLHADRDGIYAGFSVSDAVRDRIVLIDIVKKEGEPVYRHVSSSTSLGVALLQFVSVAERDRLMADVKSHLVPVIR
jgi:biotin carboxylase